MRILIVEDDELRRAATRRLLERHGCRVQEAATGAEALALLRDAHTPFVVLVDYLLPEMCGYRLLEQLAAEPELAAHHTVLVMSSHPALVELPLPQVGGRWMRLVPKPIEIARLRTAIALASHPRAQAPSRERSFTVPGSTRATHPPRSA